MKKVSLTAVALTTLALGGCGSLNNSLAEKTKTIEYYRIFNIETDSHRSAVITAASDGLGQNINNATENTPIPSFSKAPAEPGRFKLINPFEGSSMAALAAASGASIKMASCEGAVWIAQANRDIQGSDNLKLTACLWEYEGGYHLDTYATFKKQTGGLMQISREMASAMVGTPEEWTEKTFLDIVRQVKSETEAEITYLEGYPKLQGTPWLDTGEEI